MAVWGRIQSWESWHWLQPHGRVMYESNGKASHSLSAETEVFIPSGDFVQELSKPLSILLAPRLFVVGAEAAGMLPPYCLQPH